MITTIADILSRPTNEITIEDLIHCAEAVKDNGDIFFIKLDGAREKCHYTVLASISSQKEELIRADENSVKEALLKVLTKYVAIKGNAAGADENER